MKKALLLLVMAGLSGGALAGESPAVLKLLQEYRDAGAGPFSAAAGEHMWTRQLQDKRSCATCHGTDLGQAGKHVRTGKAIEPMAPSVNPARLSDERKIKKWLYRNCKWTYGRECSAQEKGDLLLFIQSK